ncbi:MAG: transporter substrate-binding domain-containing protein [Pseudomonadota bacterium]
MFHRRSLIAAALAGVMLGGVTAALPTPAQAQESLIDTVVERGVLRVGVGNFVPWVFRSKTGEIIGFEVDVATKLAEDMGVEVEFVPTVWDGMIPALLSGNFDVVISGMSLRPDRMLRVNFTSPYASSGNMLAASVERMPDRTSLDDFNDRDVTIAAVRGSTAASAVQAQLPRARLLQFDAEADVLQEVLNGNADAYVGAVPKPGRDAASFPDQLYLPIRETFQGTLEGFALRKGDPDALNYFNSWIMLNVANGFLQERWEYWFTGQDWADQVPE